MLPRLHRSRRIYVLVGALMLLAFALASLVLYTGSSTNTGTAPNTGAAPAQPIPQEGMLGTMFYFGPRSLEARIVGSDAIARVKLVSTAQVVEEVKDVIPDSGTEYENALEFTFDVQEYLKGSGGSRLTAIAYDADVRFATREAAAASGEDFLSERDTRWDDREAIVFLWADSPALPSTKKADRYGLGALRFNGEDHYTIASIHNVKWLPAASAPILDADTATGGEQRFLLWDPTAGTASGGVNAQSADAQAGTITLSELKGLIAELDAEIKAGDGSQEYWDCVYDKYVAKGRVDYYKQKLAAQGEGYYYKRHDHALASGQAAGTHVYTDAIFWAGVEPPPKETIPAKYAGMFQLDGRDSHLFGIEYPGEVSLARPLLSGEYRFYFISMPKKYVVCDGLPEEERKRHEHFVTVTAPVGTVHEAFFDLVGVGTAAVADGYRGQLAPASYTADDSEIAIQRIGWDENRAWMEFASSPSLAGHHIDFIELDGSVGLRLDFDDATAVTTEGGGQALVWGVCAQPWAADDELMLRISESGESLTGATNDTTCDGQAVSLTVPLQTASFSPTSDASIKPPLAPAGNCGTAGLWDCLDEAGPDGDGSRIYLFANSALRVGFTAGSVTGTIADVRFEVVLKGQTGTVAADQYSFEVYSGTTAVATVNGPEDVGTEWTELVVSDPAITGGLSAGLSGVAFQVNGPSSGPRLEWSWVRMVVEYKPADA